MTGIELQVQLQYKDLKDKIKNKDILDQYNYLETRFAKAFTCSYEDGSKADIMFRAIIKLLADTEAEIKGLG